MTVDPEAIITEGVKIAARQQRQRDVILGALLLVAGFVFALLGVLILAGAFTDAMELGFGGLMLGLSTVIAGAARLTRALR